MDPLTVFVASILGSLVSDALRTRRKFADFYPASASRSLEPHLGWIPMRGDGVRWFVEPGEAVWIEARYLRPLSGNLFSEDKLGAVGKAVRDARRGGEPIPMYPGYGQVHRLTAEWISESLAYQDWDLGEPFTTGDRELDDWLVRKYNREANEPDENAEMEERLAAAVASDQGDLGKWTATVRDGNHRTFGAVLGGEEKIAVRIYDNDVQSMREAVRRCVLGELPAWHDEASLELLLKAIDDTGAKPSWLDEQTAKDLFRRRGVGTKLLPMWIPSIEESRGKVYVTVEGLGRVLEVMNHGQGPLKPVKKGLDEELFPDDGGKTFRHLHDEALRRSGGG